jgi:hypothetical protein
MGIYHQLTKPCLPTVLIGIGLVQCPIRSGDRFFKYLPELLIAILQWRCHVGRSFAQKIHTVGAGRCRIREYPPVVAPDASRQQHATPQSAGGVRLR